LGYGQRLLGSGALIPSCKQKGIIVLFLIDDY